MSVSLPKNVDLLGVPLMKVRDLLNYWECGGDRTGWRLGKLRGIKLSPFTVAVLIDELRSRGLIGRGTDHWGRPLEDSLTEAGKALASAKATRRTPKAAASRILGGVLDAADRINARPDLPFRIARIWLFGSMIDPEKEDVGDVDHHVEYESHPAGADPESQLSRYLALAEELEAPSGLNVSGSSHWVTERLLYGERRHPLLAPADSDEIAALGCPCRLIYDAGRGGRVEDGILPRHPRSDGPRPDLPAKRTMPELGPVGSTIDPVHVDLLVPRLLYAEDFETSFPAKTAPDKAWRTFNLHHGRMPTVVSAPPTGELAARYHRPVTLDLSNCDGRGRFAVLLEIPGPHIPGVEVRRLGCAVVIGRSIVSAGTEEEVTTCRMTVEGYDDGGTVPTPEMSMMLRWVVHACLQADLERIMRRGLELGRVPPFKFEFEDKVDHPVVKLLLDAIEDDADIVPEIVAGRIDLLGDATSNEGGEAG